MSEMELYHHQRKGAHWGEHNGPPYPLDKSVVKKKYKGGKIFKSNEDSDADKRKKLFTKHKVKKTVVKKEQEEYEPRGFSWGPLKDYSEKTDSVKPKIRPASEMTDDELNTAIKRQKLEKEYEREFGIEDAREKARKDFIDRAKKELIVDPLMDAGKKYITAALTDSLEKSSGFDLGGNTSKLARSAKEKQLRKKLADMTIEEIKAYNNKEAEINKYIEYKLGKKKEKDKNKDKDKK